MQKPENTRENIFSNIYQSERSVDILSYSLMPNHFHFLLKQKHDKGVSLYIANISNAYTKYFNTKHNRRGPLLEGVFKGVHIETEEQLSHVSRYIHINPVVSSIIPKDKLQSYSWSSYPEFLLKSDDDIVQKDQIMEMFKSVSNYEQFTNNNIDYGKKLEIIKHLVME